MSLTVRLTEKFPSSIAFFSLVSADGVVVVATMAIEAKAPASVSAFIRILPKVSMLKNRSCTRRGCCGVASSPTLIRVRVSAPAPMTCAISCRMASKTTRNFSSCLCSSSATLSASR